MIGKKALGFLLAMVICAGLGACGAEESPAVTTQAQTGQSEASSGEARQPRTRTIADGMGREVEVPAAVERAVCVGVGALRYSCYVGAADRMVGVEDYETKAGMSRLYNYVNFHKFKDIPAGSPAGIYNKTRVLFRHHRSANFKAL